MIKQRKKRKSKMTKRNTGFPIPDELLRTCYLKVAIKAGLFRETFISRTANIEAVKVELGPDYAHISVDDLRHRITTCCKSPRSHGGGWAGTKCGVKG